MGQNQEVNPISTQSNKVQAKVQNTGRVKTAYENQTNPKRSTQNQIHNEGENNWTNKFSTLDKGKYR